MKCRAAIESLDVVPERLSSLPLVLTSLVGDFNFDDKKEWGSWRRPPSRPSPSFSQLATASPAPAAPLENEVLAEIYPDYLDAWPVVNGPDARGWTFDGGANPFVTDSMEQMRYDRVLCKGSMTPRKAELLGGADPISDHYGLKVEFE